MRDFNGNTISGIVNITDSSEFGKPLSSMSNEELAAEESFRMVQLKRERTMRCKQLLTMLVIAAVLAIIAYVTYLAWGDWRPANVFIGVCSVAVAYAGVQVSGRPNRFEKNHTEAIRAIRDIYRLRNYRP